MTALLRAALYPNCTEGVTRRGQYVPCDKTTVAVRYDPDSGDPYPVCAHHARADMVPLLKILEDR